MWEEFEVLEEDLSWLKFVDDGVKPKEQECSGAWTRLRTQSALVDASFHNTTYDWLRSEEDEAYDRDRWESWLQDQSTPQGNENHLSIAISHPSHFPELGRTSTSPGALKYLSLPEDGFRDVFERMKIHPSLLRAARDSGPVATRSKFQVGGRECVVYILRLSNAAVGQSAMAITHLPGKTTPGTQQAGSRTNALILGYNHKDITVFEKTLRQRRREIFNPCTPIMAFMEVEKQRRFADVRLRRTGLLQILHETSSAGEVAAAAVAGRPDRHRDVDDNVGLYVSVSDLVVDALQPWRRQVLSLKAEVGGDEPRLAAELGQLALQYEHRLDRCDRILQGASLAYQMETTYLSRNDALTAIADGKRVKAIALLTMIFLPATFTATLMAVPQIEDAIDAQKIFGDKAWLWYLILSLSFTSFVVALYLTWGCTSVCRKPRSKASRDGSVA